MILNLFRVIIWESGKLIDKIGIVMGNSYSEAAGKLEEYFGCIEEISYLSPIGDANVYELNESSYEVFSDIKDNFIW